MKQEDKNLLFLDLCARLPYGVTVKIKNKDNEERIVDLTYGNIDYVFTLGDWWKECKPYLSPMSSMTGEEMLEIEMMNNNSIQHIDTVGVRFKSFYDTAYNEMYDLFDWLNKNMFDYRGLIQKGLAIEAPEGMY